MADPARSGLKQSGKKADRRDAHELARRLFLGDIDRSATSSYATDEESGQTKVLRVRHQLVTMRQELVKQIRGLLNANRIVSPHCSLWRPGALAWLQQLDFCETGLRASLAVWIDTLEQTQISIHALDATIKQLAAHSKTARLLLAVVPSVKAQTALTISSELGDV